MSQLSHYLLIFVVATLALSDARPNHFGDGNQVRSDFIVFYIQSKAKLIKEIILQWTRHANSGLYFRNIS